MPVIVVALLLLLSTAQAGEPAPPYMLALSGEQVQAVIEALAEVHLQRFVAVRATIIKQVMDENDRRAKLPRE